MVSAVVQGYAAGLQTDSFAMYWFFVKMVLFKIKSMNKRLKAKLAQSC